MQSWCRCTFLRILQGNTSCLRLKAGVAIGLFFLGCFLPLASYGQAPEVVASIDTTEMLIGDQLDFNILVAHRADQHILWPFWLDSLGGFELIGKPVLDTLEKGELLEEIQQLTLTAFDSGEYQIPAIPIRYVANGGRDTFSVLTDPKSILVHTVPVDTTQAIKPIKELLNAPLTFRELLPWLLVGLIAFLIIGGLVYWFFIRKKAEPVFTGPPPPKIPPHEIAMRKLANLEQKKLWQEGDIKTYYVELTEIVREYLEGRYKVQALELTTDEIVYQLSAKEIPVRQFDQLKELLTRADFAKFAKLRPGPTENLMGMEVARNFVKETRNFAIESDDAVNTDQEVSADLS
ncbi:MAG: hypothetical protein AAF694_07185 [Bacteroidota bacterium]